LQLGNGQIGNFDIDHKLEQRASFASQFSYHLLHDASWKLNILCYLRRKRLSNRKYPASPEEMKLVAKFVTVAWRDDKALRLFT
jgi:hypothetical protein